MEAATVGAGEPIQGEKAQEDDGRGGGGGGRAKEERIRVSVRLRPLNSKELARNDQSDWECISDTTIIFRNTLPERSMFPAAYTFDRVFRHDSDTKRVYEEGAKEVALSVVSGINASIFAYGQTSSGKTYTMTGITEYAMADIYDYIQRHKEREFVLKFSAMEIYNEAVRDLLSADSAPLRLLDDPDRGTTVEKLTEELLRDWGHMQELLSICEAQRQIGETSLNETSSRSHQILRLSIESSAREFAGKDNSSSLAASVNFVDLAGSERASQTLSAGARLKEGCHINRSLLTLGTVIRKLSKGRSGHIPFRDSKLTRILQSSLGGNARTAIICTMSPARSHVEQSRNTLLFASCAKEVATSAQVNVVMSDKALVKHLQKELARLEGELRCSGLPSSSSYSETLLKEKDAQIQKMETEMRELTRQRDLAQSRLDDWLRAAGDREPQQSGEFFPYSMRHGLNTLEDELFPLSESSSVHDDGFICSNALGDSSHCGVNHSDSFQALDSSSASGASSVSSAHKGLQGAAPGGSLEMELCRDVRCIEIDETSTGADGQSNEVLTKGCHDPPPPPTAIGDLGDREPKEIERVEDVNGRNAIDSSPWLLQGPLPSPRSQGLTRSRSCRASLMHRSAPLWLPEEEQPSAHAQPSSFLRGSSAKSGGFPRTPPPLNCGAGKKRTHLEAGNRSPQREPQSSLEPASIKSEPEESITSISSFIEEMKGMAQNRFQSQLDDAQAEDQKGVDHISSDTAIYPAESPSWPAEFERQRQEIIRLWHTCSVSLLHRTYFFLLFKGDPADSIYMEVELRRLSFLKRVFTEGSVDKSAAENGLKITPASSMRALRREREMLCHKLQKRLSAEERESLYRKWGIPLHSKQRKAQLSRLLWSDTSNMDHIKDSASVVATLVGLLEPDQALKEMFQLSFMPQRIPTRSQSWKHSRSSLI